MDPDSLQQIISQADGLYAGRDDIENVSLSVELLRQSLNEADSYELAWRLGRALFFLGAEAREKTAARSFHARGAEAGRRAARVRPKQVEGHFWYGVNLALLAQSEPPHKAFGHALRAKGGLQRAIEIEPAYHSAGPLRVLARLQHKLPRLLGGGPAVARNTFERALAIAPRNTVTHLYFAELLIECKEPEQARRELKAVLAGASEPGWEYETKRDVVLAKELLETLRLHNPGSAN